MSYFPIRHALASKNVEHVITQPRQENKVGISKVFPKRYAKLPRYAKKPFFNKKRHVRKE